MAAHFSPYAGAWYPRQPRKLDSILGELFEQSVERTGPHVLTGGLAYVVPHAAPSYCGAVAAAAYRHLGSADGGRVFLLAFSHHRLVQGIEMPRLAAYRTPLGETAVDEGAVQTLSACPVFRMAEEAAICDHSLEVQLPYLQKAAPERALIPMCVGHLSAEERAEAADAIARSWRPGDVLIASSDLTHYGRDFGYVPFPNDARTAARLKRLDTAVMEAAGSLDADVFLAALRESNATVCGRDPIALLLEVLRALPEEELFERQLDYRTSGELMGDFTASVSYAALGFFPRRSFEVGEDEREVLLRSAWRAIQWAKQTGTADVPPCPEKAVTRRAPAFVTLRHEGRVIGCAGRLDSDVSLADEVAELAVSALLHDPRRLPEPPDDPQIEISILTPLKLTPSAEAIRVGTDGACIDVAGRRAVLLPQALRLNWAPADVLRALLRKAGIPDEAAPAGIRLFTFGAQVFGTHPRPAQNVSATSSSN